MKRSVLGLMYLIQGMRKAGDAVDQKLQYSFLISFMLSGMVIHQIGALGMTGGDESVALPSYAAFMKDYGNAFRSFQHGALHGCMTGVLFVLPITAINGLFEQKSWRYILVIYNFSNHPPICT